MISALTDMHPWLHPLVLIGLDVAAKSLLLLAITLGTAAFLGRKRLLARSALWNACVLGLLVLPITSMCLPRLRIAVLPPTPAGIVNQSVIADQPALAPATLDSSAFAPAPTAVVPAAPLQMVEPATPDIAAPPAHVTEVDLVLVGILAYAAGAALLAMRLVLAVADVRRLRRSGRVVQDPQWRETLTNWVRRLEISDPVQLLHSPRVSVPVAFGWLRPAVMIPTSVLESPLSARRSCILLHELAHVRRRDYLWQLLLKVLQIGYWPNPLIWLAGRLIAASREEAADALCVYHASSPSEYHLTLLEVAQSLVRRPAAALGIAMARSPRIAQRLERIDRGLRVPNCLAGRPVRSALTIGAVLIAGIVGACQLSARENAAAAETPAATTAQPPTVQPPRMRYFVALVVGKDRMTFEGEDATWNQVRDKLTALPNLKQTVFTVAVDNPDVTIGRFHEAMSKAHHFVDEFGMEYVSDVGVHPLGSKGDRPQELPSDQPKQTRHFVLLVVGKDRMTFQGEDTTWEEVHKRLAALPDPRHTVFEIAVDNPDVTTGRFSEAQGRAFDAVKKYGLEYVSDTGVKLLGTKAGPPQELPTGTEGRRRQTTSRPTSGSSAGFAIVPTQDDSAAEQLLSQREKDRYVRQLQDEGAGAGRQRGDEYQWFEVACEYVPTHTYVETYRDRKYILVYGRPPMAMFTSADGRSSWGFARGMVTKDRAGRPAINFDLDDRGGKLLSALTKANIQRPLASIIGGRILLIAFIRSEISNNVQVTGVFTEADLRQILSQLPVTSTRPAKQDSAASQPADAYRLVLNGWKLKAEEAGRLEDRLQSEPGDLATRTRLLGYYYGQDTGNDRRAEARRRHVLWIIQYRPESKIAGLSEAVLDPDQDAEGYRQASADWGKQVEVHSKDTAVLGNAAAFFRLHDFKTAERLLNQANQLEPKQSEWPGRLADLYQLQMNRASGKLRREWAGKALAQDERAYELTSASHTRSYLLNDLAKTAFEAGELDKATQYARRDLDDAQNRADWNYGNAIHHGNLVLGRIALSKGDVEQAKKYLALAGKTPGSPQLNSFGPNMLLASELLKRGEKRAVLDYLRAVGSFWSTHKDRLEEWTKAVKNGNMPDFGANLDY